MPSPEFGWMVTGKAEFSCGLVDGVVVALPHQDVRQRQQHTDETSMLVGRPPDLARSQHVVLRRRHQSRPIAIVRLKPRVGQPAVVGSGDHGGEVRIWHRNQAENLAIEQNRAGDTVRIQQMRRHVAAVRARRGALRREGVSA